MSEQKVTGFWNKSSLLITKDMWLDLQPGSEIFGGPIETCDILPTIAPGQSEIIEIEKRVSNIYEKDEGDPYPMCVLLHISEKTQIIIYEKIQPDLLR